MVAFVKGQRWTAFHGLHQGTYKFRKAASEQEKWRDAELILRDSLSLQRESQPKDWTVFKTMSMLGEALLGQEISTDAEKLLIER